MARGYLVVEGHGEVRAALNLVHRLWSDLGLPFLAWADPPIRGLGLTQRQGVAKACALVRSKPDAAALLLLRDEDDHCPAEKGPLVASWLAAERLPFPAAAVLAHREFEAWFLPCLKRMAGQSLVDERGVARPGLRADARYDGDPEAIRDVKGLLTTFFPPGRIYKPVTDQLPLTRLIDFAALRQAPAPSFGTLERALRHLSDHRGRREAVYPPPSKA